MSVPLRARAGFAYLGSQVVVHGKDSASRVQLELGFVALLAVQCHRASLFEPAQVRVLEEAWVATGYPDARIWCNRITGYLGSARVDPGLSMSAAIAATNSIVYGFRAMSLAYPHAARHSRGRRRAAADGSRRRSPKSGVARGYGRPQHGHDERIAVPLRSLARAGLQAGPR
ncbi:MAG: hypothetical protein QM756_04125 [Polyangiaceae bacterium]